MKAALRNSPLSCRRCSGFGRTDLLVSLAVLTVLGSLALFARARTHEQAQLNLCISNLQQVGRAVRLYADDHGSILPAPVAELPGAWWWWYKEQVKGYVGLQGPSSPSDRLFACPLDRGYSEPKPFWSSARFDYGSYVFNGVTLSGAPNVAGLHFDRLKRPVQAMLVMEWTAHAPLSWHRSRTGRANAPFYCDAESVVAFGDGHAGLTKIYYDGYTAAYMRDPIPGYDYSYSGN